MKWARDLYTENYKTLREVTDLNAQTPCLWTEDLLDAHATQSHLQMQRLLIRIPVALFADVENPP